MTTRTKDKTSIQISLYLNEELFEQLRKVSYLSRKTQRELIEEGLRLLFKSAGGKYEKV